MKELRCKKCGKKILEHNEHFHVCQGEVVIEAICPRCKKMNTLKFITTYKTID